MKKKRILIISQYFKPENFRINDIATELVKKGYKVIVLTGIPNYPLGKFYEGYDYRHRRYEKWNGIYIIRIPLIARGSNSVRLVINYLSFMLSGFIWKCLVDVHADLVFTYEVSPMTQGMVGVWYAKKHHIPHYIYVTDLWPENVKYTTGIHNKMIIGILQIIVDYIYHNSDKILTSSRSFIEPIRRRKVDKLKIEYWPQYAEDIYKPMKFTKHPEDTQLYLVFAGNVGYAQGLNILVEAARILRTKNLNVRFHIIGDGRYLFKLKEIIKAENLEKYFQFTPHQPQEEVVKFLSQADALLITLAKNEVFAITIPAKTQSCMACGKPILVSADGEVQRIIREAKAGLVSDAEDVNGFVKNIEKMIIISDADLKQYGKNALMYSYKNFNKYQLLDRLEEIFQGK
ncbi:MAG: glycosyltransferase family 4 protein [Lachnospiraceae bacterium]|nr:glycosyltransferase family 4 protein [Lachnospiraceae bacterium]